MSQEHFNPCDILITEASHPLRKAFCNINSAKAVLFQAVRQHMFTSVEAITSKYFKTNLCSQTILPHMELTAVKQTNLLHQSTNTMRQTVWAITQLVVSCRKPD